MAKGIIGANLFQSSIMGVINFAKEGLKLASDLTEVQNVVDTTFGGSAAVINDWAKSAGAAFGISELQAKKFNGTLGAMMKSSGVSADKLAQMSMSMSGLAGDFASFYNLKPEEAFDKIRAGISGETEPLKQIGINMSVANLEAYALTQGLNKKYQAMTQAEQVQLRYNYLLKVSKDAQGDFAKTLSTSAANQERVAEMQKKAFAANLMSALLPAQIDMYKQLNKVLAWLIENVEGVTIALKAIAIVLGVVTGAWILYKIAMIAAAIPMAINTALLWGAQIALVALTIAEYAGAAGMAIMSAASYALGIALAVATWPITLIILAIAALIAIGVLLYRNWDKIGAFFSELWTGIKDSFSQAIDWIVAKFTAVTDWISKKWQGVKDFFGVGGDVTVNGQPGANGQAATSPGGMEVPAMATGTNFVPKDMFAMLHKGESVVPAKYNNGAGGGVTNDIKVNVSLAVPAGTAENQAAYIKTVAKQAINEAWQGILRQTAVVNTGV